LGGGPVVCELGSVLVPGGGVVGLANVFIKVDSLLTANRANLIGELGALNNSVLVLVGLVQLVLGNCVSLSCSPGSLSIFHEFFLTSRGVSN